jgi:phenylalanyl-tRNA synthetase alpha subunit
MDDIEVGGNDFGNRIVYKETEDQIHLIEFYRREGVVIEKYVTSGDDYDDGDNYLGSYLKRYKDLSPSIITEIFYLLLTQI